MKSKAGKMGTFVLFFVLAFGMMGFIAKIIGDKERDRTAGTIGVALALARQHVQVIRVHDVQPVRDALLLFAASGGIDDA